ncbi:MAG: GAK system ATP-grasp enzyme [Pseudomonadota bacterium]
MSAKHGKCVGVLGLPGGWSSDGLLQALASRAERAVLIDPRLLEFDLENGRVLHQGLDLATLDGLVIKKLGQQYSPHLLDRLEMLRFLAAGGLPIFSRPRAIGRLLDRLSCTAELRLRGIPLPPTMVTQDQASALKAVERLGPCVLKPLYTSKARGMTVLSPGPRAADQLAQFQAQGHRFFYLQKMVQYTGQDLGVVFLGGRYLGTYARAARFQASNGDRQPEGGKYLAHQPGPEVLELAQRAQAIFGLDFTCVDVAESDEGPVVFEVSAFGGFRGLWETQRMDAAGLLAEHVLERLGQ